MASPNPFPTLGILGGGQLGRMMALAAIRMGLHVRFLAPRPTGAIEGLGESLFADWKNQDVLRAFAIGCHAVTVESEWAPADSLMEVLPEETALWPHPDTLTLIRDKGVQKNKMVEAGLPVPDFACCATQEEALATAEDFGYPVLLKKYRGSYDGYGNATVHTPDELRKAWPDLAAEDGLLVEAFAPFVRELAVLVARRPGGQHVIYPVAYTEQQDHRCHAVVVPAAISPEITAEARRIGLAAVEAVEGVGITAVELFEMEDGRVLVNELAPRPHNTGHYSIEGCYTSQFENHVRGVLDLPLGQPDLREDVAVMINILGHREGKPQFDGFPKALNIPGVAIHLYDKNDVRPRRKMGHVTATGTAAAETRRRAEQAADLIRL
ncbi:MAG TPA: 5-(carboxyamino)imidazole ribonucleotide synthase [Rhodothermales bacterium]|nr:5-(carboxyamino)imidazole ribonucleotide synthase [Rhodothermales bacterium]